MNKMRQGVTVVPCTCPMNSMQTSMRQGGVCHVAQAVCCALAHNRGGHRHADIGVAAYALQLLHHRVVGKQPPAELPLVARCFSQSHAQIKKGVARILELLERGPHARILHGGDAALHFVQRRQSCTTCATAATGATRATSRGHRSGPAVSTAADRGDRPGLGR